MPPTCSSTTLPIAKKLCYHINSTNKMQLIRVIDNHSCNYEKVVFPQERILFEALPEGRLEVYIEREGKQILKKIFSCQNLQTHYSKQKSALI